MTADARDLATLRAIDEFTAREGYPPSTADLMAALGLASANTVHERVWKLVRKGLAQRVPNIARSLTLTPEGVRAIMAVQ